jgi:hypothetical protein
MSDAKGNDAGFAGSSAGEDQDWPAERFDGLPLLGVERIQIQHRARECSAPPDAGKSFAKNLAKNF